MWLLHLLVTLIIAGLLTSIPYPGYAGNRADRFGMGQVRRIPCAQHYLRAAAPRYVIALSGSGNRSSLWAPLSG